jgi:hypothetical protein
MIDYYNLLNQKNRKLNKIDCDDLLTIFGFKSESKAIEKEIEPEYGDFEISDFSQIDADLNLDTLKHIEDLDSLLNLDNTTVYDDYLNDIEEDVVGVSEYEYFAEDPDRGRYKQANELIATFDSIEIDPNSIFIYQERRKIKNINYLLAMVKQLPRIDLFLLINKNIKEYKYPRIDLNGFCVNMVNILDLYYDYLEKENKEIKLLFWLGMYNALNIFNITKTANEFIESKIVNNDIKYKLNILLDLSDEVINRVKQRGIDYDIIGDKIKISKESNFVEVYKKYGFKMLCQHYYFGLSEKKVQKALFYYKKDIDLLDEFLDG